MTPPPPSLETTPMRITKVVEYRHWKNRETGLTASLYGAAPWYGEKPDEWELVGEGWTWVRDDGMIGLGRRPAKTKEEAEAVMKAINDRDDSRRLSFLALET